MVLRWNVHEWANRTPGEVFEDASKRGEHAIEAAMFETPPYCWNIGDWAPRNVFLGLCHAVKA